MDIASLSSDGSFPTYNPIRVATIQLNYSTHVLRYKFLENDDLAIDRTAIHVHLDRLIDEMLYRMGRGRPNVNERPSIRNIDDRGMVEI